MPKTKLIDKGKTEKGKELKEYEFEKGDKIVRITFEMPPGFTPVMGKGIHSVLKTFCWLAVEQRTWNPAVRRIQLLRLIGYSTWQLQRGGMKKWRAKNREKVREYKRRYYAEHRFEIRQQKKDYYRRNRERILERQKKYYDEGGGRETKREYYQRNRASILGYKKQYRIRFPEKMKLRERKAYWRQKARERLATVA